MPEGDGTKTVYVRFNIAGLLSGTYSSTITLDTAAPAVSIVSPASGEINTNAPLLNYSASEGTSVVKMDVIIIHAASGSHFGPMANGAHTISVEATDAAGNVGVASQAFKVNAIPPTASITSPALGITHDYSPPLIYTVSCCTAVVKLDGAVIPKISGDRLDPLRNGLHTITVEAMDSTGSIGSASVDFEVAYTQIQISTSSWLSGIINSSFSQRLFATGGITGQGYSWSVINGSLPPGLQLDHGAGLITGIPTTTGTYLVTLRVADNSGDNTTQQFKIYICVQEPGGSNLALNKTFSSSSNWDANQTAVKAFDGTLDTDWQAGSGNGPGQGFNNSWVEVDFGTNLTFNKVRLSEEGSRTLGYRIEYWNGQIWQTAYDGTTLANKPAFKVVSFATVTGSKVRVLFTSGSTLSPIIYEFEVYLDEQVMDGLVSVWHLNNNADDAVGSNNGILKGNATFGQGKMNQALKLDSTEGFVEVSDDNSLDRDLSAMTLSVWVKVNYIPTSPQAKSYVPVGKEQSYRFVIDPEGGVYFVVATNNNQWYSPGTVAGCITHISIGKWFHLVGTYDGKIVTCYINGLRESSNTDDISGKMVDRSETLTFGYIQTPGIIPMDGMIDEVRLYNRALSDAEVKDLYYSRDCSRYNYADGLVSEWHLDNSPNDNVSGNNGVLRGNATFGPGTLNQALIVDGNGSYLEVPDDGSLGGCLSAMTLSAWVKVNSFPLQGADEYWPVTKGGIYRFNIGPWGHVAICVGTKKYPIGSPGTIIGSATPQLSIGNWYHLVGTYDGRFANLYVNGTKEGTGTQAISGSIADDSEPLTFGNSIGAMDGMIDEVRIYNRVFSDDEVKALYDSYK